jgi:hypothetical protein
MPVILSEERLALSSRRLLVASDDLIASTVRLSGSTVDQNGTQRHRDLFQGYLSELRPVVEFAVNWWVEAMAYQTEQQGNAERARQSLLEEYPAGPASQGRFVAVVRKYWLACDALNATLPPSAWLDPPKFLLGWPIETGESLAVEVLASQPYWPICLTEDGQWF